jgi:molybdopterin synthase sulfur carrier subunit
MPDSRSSADVTVNLVYLARLREAFGRPGEALTLSGGDASVAAVLALLRARGAPYAAELAAGRAVRVAVNHALVDADVVVRDGDEVALLPPVTGG